MLTIFLVLIGLVAIAIITEPESTSANQEESIPVPIRTDSESNFRKFG